VTRRFGRRFPHDGVSIGEQGQDAIERPFSFVADRNPNRHMGIGFGIHACIGMHLAKIGMTAAFQIKHYPN
jgi:hypothetical protein